MEAGRKPEPLSGGLERNHSTGRNRAGSRKIGGAAGTGGAKQIAPGGHMGEGHWLDSGGRRKCKEQDAKTEEPDGWKRLWRNMTGLS